MSQRPLRIGMYIQAVRVDQLTGIGRHVIALINGLAEIDAVNEYYLYYPTSGAADEQAVQLTPPSPRFHLRPVWLPKNWHYRHPTAWWDWRLPLALWQDRIDVFHGPNHYLPKTSRPTVVTIHDVAYFKMDVHGDARDEALRIWTKKALDRSNAVIALSQNTRQDLLDIGVPDAKIHVIYGGGNVVPEDRIAFDRRAEMVQRLGLPEQYIFYVGAFNPRKNVPFLVRGFADWKKKTGSPHKLVLAGPKENAAGDIAAAIEEAGVKEDVIITGFVADWELPLLYKGADVFVLPSRYEGFTLVTIEAMSYGVPVISTQCSSIQEGTGDAAILVPVDDVPALSAALADVLGNPQQREQMKARGFERSQLFTWANNARQTLNLYRQISPAQLR